MEQALFSGVSGLSAHQSILDTTANNLANISTPGYKASIDNFATALSQTHSAGNAPGTQTGGTNPNQLGLGVSRGAVNVNMNQGALQTTGRSLDLAIQGDGFFKVTNINPQDGTYYTRVGNFGFDQNDDLVDLASGLRVNGIQQGVQGNISLTQYRSINATATKNVTYQGNLDANSGSLRGPTLDSVLPLQTASADGSSFAPSSETDLLQNLTIFRGTGTDPGQTLSGSATLVGGLPTETLKAATTVGTGGKVSFTVTVPPEDYSTTPVRLSIQRGGVTIGTVLLDQDLQAASTTARTYTVTSSVDVNAGDSVSLLAAEDPAGGGSGTVAGTYTFGAEMNTSLVVFGTRPDGVPYGGKISVNPWTDTVGDLVTKINSALTQGTSTFAAVQLQNGSLTAKALQPGDGFSLFVGESDLLPLGAPEAASAIAAANLNVTAPHTPGNTDLLASNEAVGGDGSLRPTFTVPADDVSGQIGSSMVITVKVNGGSVGTITVPAADYTISNNVFTLQNFPQVKSTDLVTYEMSGNLDFGGDDIQVDTVVGKLTESTSSGLGFNYRGVSTANIASVTMAEGGLLSPTFTMPPVDLSTQVGRSLKVSIKVNGSEVGSVSLPPADYTGGADKVFSMPNLPHIKAGDVVSYDISGTLDLGAGNALSWTTALVKDSDTTSILQDRDTSGNANGQPDLFEQNPTDPVTTDVNRWMYSSTTNTNFNWYQVRFAPETVNTTIDVYDTNGTKHTLSGQFFKSGTKVDPNTGALTNVWDMIASINPAEGTLTGDLITGIQFDSQGRYKGDSSLGTTARGVGLDSNGYRGQPDNNRLEVTWADAGPTTVQMDYGATNGTDGLTGFGTASTAAAINQDGFANGSLDTISVQQNGDIKGLYSNGQSQTIGTVEVYTFRNPEGLLSAGGNLWQPSSNSGQETPRTAGQGGAGTITAGSLEGSNVDIASEFTRLITAQRGFQVNARVIQTADSILQELAGLIR